MAAIPDLPRHRILDMILKGQSAVGTNIRTLRQRKGWTQVKLGELMGLAQCLYCVCRRRPPQRPAAGFHRRGSQTAGRYFRHLPVAGHHAVRDAALPGEAIRLSQMQNEWKCRMHQAASGSGHDADVPAGEPDPGDEHGPAPAAERKGAQQ